VEDKSRWLMLAPSLSKASKACSPSAPLTFGNWNWRCSTPSPNSLPPPGQPKKRETRIRHNLSSRHSSKMVMMPGQLVYGQTFVIVTTALHRTLTHPRPGNSPSSDAPSHPSLPLVMALQSRFSPKRATNLPKKA